MTGLGEPGRVSCQPLLVDLPRLLTDLSHAKERIGRWPCPPSLVMDLPVASFSNAREKIQMLMGHGHEDSMADQEANRWGRSGKDPNHFRPAGLPDKY